jgi:hypothetical protein
VLSRLFRRLVLEKLAAAHKAGALQFFCKHAALTNLQAFAAYSAPLRNREWVVPRGWPENSPLWSSTLSSYRVIPRCHRYLTPRYRQLIVDAAASKRVHHLRSPAEIQFFLAAIEKERVRH